MVVILHLYSEFIIVLITLGSRSNSTDLDSNWLRNEIGNNSPTVADIQSDSHQVTQSNNQTVAAKPGDVVLVVRLVEEHVLPVDSLSGVLLMCAVCNTYSIRPCDQSKSIVCTCSMPSLLMPCSLQSFFQNSKPARLLD